MQLQYTPDQDGFIEEPYLFSLSLVYQTHRKVIVCQKCHQGIVPTKVKDHFKHSHKEEKIKVNVDCINQIANALNIPKSYPQPWTEGPHPKVAGEYVLLKSGTGVCYAMSVCTWNPTLNLRNPSTATSTATLVLQSSLALNVLTVPESASHLTNSDNVQH